MADELAERRWSKSRNPSKHKPVDALRAVLRDIEAGHLNPSHVIVVYATDDEDGDEAGTTGFYQAGSLSGYFGAMGLLTRCLQIMGDAG